jgi:hypothetical protein
MDGKFHEAHTAIRKVNSDPMLESLGRSRYGRSGANPWLYSTRLTHKTSFPCALLLRKCLPDQGQDPDGEGQSRNENTHLIISGSSDSCSRHQS